MKHNVIDVTSILNIAFPTDIRPISLDGLLLCLTQNNGSKFHYHLLSRNMCNLFKMYLNITLLTEYTLASTLVISWIIFFDAKMIFLYLDLGQAAL